MMLRAALLFPFAMVAASGNPISLSLTNPPHTMIAEKVLISISEKGAVVTGRYRFRVTSNRQGNPTSNYAIMPIVIFESERLLCRRWVSSDFEALYSVYSDSEAMRWVGDGKPITRAECEQWFAVTEANYSKRGYGMFALEDRVSGDVVGFCGLVHPGGQPDPEIKYAFRRVCWGRGLASEALPKLLAYGACSHGLSRIIATVAPDNAASQRVLAKSGMQFSQRRVNDDGSVTLVFEWFATRH